MTIKPNPFLLEGTALVSFSGGRTSARMLKAIIDAHGGRLPENIVVAFANTGKEREETLRFVHECGTRWGIHIYWIEWCAEAPGFEIVGYNSASRDGEPFAALIEKKKRVPNWKERWCTQFLKVLPMFSLMRSLGHGEPGNYLEAIGLRDDEGIRILNGLENAEKHGRRVIYPLAKAKIRKDDINAFWAEQDFDLQLPRGVGNCTHCFAMARADRINRIRLHPDDLPWWLDKEARFGRFDRRDSMQKLVDEARRAPTFFEDDWEPSDSECGVACAGEPV